MPLSLDVPCSVSMLISHNTSAYNLFLAEL